MAFVDKPSEEEAAQGLTAAPAAPITGGTGGVTGAAPTQRPEKGGTQFADVSRYLTQNQPAGQRFASRIGSNVLGAGNEARSAIGQQEGNLANARTTFNQGYQANQPIGANQELLNRVSRNPASFFNNPYPQQQPLSILRDPGRGGMIGKQQQNKQTKNAGNQTPIGPITTPLTPTNPADVSSYQSMLNTTYGGPRDLNLNIDYGNLGNLSSKAGGLADKYKTFQGREDLLGGLNKPNYSDAARNLDAILLGSAPSRRILGSASSQNQDIQGRIDALRDLEGQAIEDVTSKVGEAEKTAKETREGAKSAGEEAVKSVKEGYNNRLSEAEALQGRRKKEALANINPQDDYLRLAALNQLMGTNYGL